MCIGKVLIDYLQAPTLYIFSYILVILGLCILLASLIGCLGVATEKKPLLVIYTIANVTLMISSIAAAAYLIFKKEGVC